MVVEVKLFATYRAGRFKVKKMELPEGALLRDVIEPLGLPGLPTEKVPSGFLSVSVPLLRFIEFLLPPMSGR